MTQRKNLIIFKSSCHFACFSPTVEVTKCPLNTEREAKKLWIAILSSLWFGPAVNRNPAYDLCSPIDGLIYIDCLINWPGCLRF